MSDMTEKSAGATIRPFHVNVPEAELTELRRRINAAKWPERETVTDQSQGVQLATIQKLARYWATDYDWRKVEAKLNAVPQFMTEIDGLDIHFIHVRSKHENALPPIVTHGWPGAIRSIRRGKKQIREAERLFCERSVLRTRDGEPPTDSIRNCGFTRRPSRLDTRPRLA
jgi:hypothetical protein